MAEFPQTGQRFRSYRGCPREQPHDRASPETRERTAGVDSFSQSQRQTAERVAWPSGVDVRTSRMTVNRPNLSPGRMMCLTLARPRSADFSRDRHPHERVMPRLRSRISTVVTVPQSQRHSAALRMVPPGITFRVCDTTVSRPKISPAVTTYLIFQDGNAYRRHSRVMEPNRSGKAPARLRAWRARKAECLSNLPGLTRPRVGIPGGFGGTGS